MYPKIVTALATGALLVVLAPLALAEAGPQDEPTTSSEGVVNINTATAEQLMLLPGIGPSRAQAILDMRAQRPFRTVQELIRVRGIGPATLRQLLPFVTVTGETTLSHEVRRRPAPSD
jgi:competence protein ComEA